MYVSGPGVMRVPRFNTSSKRADVGRNLKASTHLKSRGVASLAGPGTQPPSTWWVLEAIPDGGKYRGHTRTFPRERIPGTLG